MSRLSDLIVYAVQAYTINGTVDRQAAVAAVRTDLEEAEKAILIDEALFDRIKACAIRARKSADDSASASLQLALFPDLHRGYSVGNTIRLTGALRLLEFEAVIKVREDQLKQDGAHLNYLKQTLATVHPLWKRNPNLDFDEVCRMYSKMMEAA